MSFTSIAKLSTRPLDTMRGLVFYKEEIKILQDRLDEMATKNSSFEARQGMEHFQNQFLMHRNNIDELKHKVNLVNEELSREIHLYGDHIIKEKLDEMDALNAEFNILEKVIKEMRREFNAFLAKWM
jgi:DNA anti-recombination protein RmuC